MKESMKVGLTKTLTTEVTEEMVAKFAGEVVHPTFSTVSMVYYMEWISRELLVPHLEAGEEGMGAAVSLKHLAPSGIGTIIELSATVTDVTKRKVVTEIIVSNSQGVIGEGEVTQVILPKQMIEKKIQESMNTYEGVK